MGSNRNTKEVMKRFGFGDLNMQSAHLGPLAIPKVVSSVLIAGVVTLLFGPVSWKLTLVDSAEGSIRKKLLGFCAGPFLYSLTGLRANGRGMGAGGAGPASGAAQSSGKPADSV